MIITIAAAWLVCGIIGAGFINAGWRADNPSAGSREMRQNFSMAVILSLIWGPAGLLASLAMTGFGADGWTLRFK